ncbi:hypothetical protein BJF85_05680 [Saccharomonospora sp. CUA-673]|uniref:hypothetical protein n=1 Tax=Saccharomonospora sp. CUA-673 TaxID=1904969 RepID=UPI000963D857|nr:hypothetical protein [Saccharomonospora sp. CUA-673]OLT40633.1 hypothetical protein BJF85_05680 [Saccharomonospora sp. CUA-673]
MPEWFWYIVSPLVFGGYFYYRWKQKQQTHNEYAEIADKLGWEYVKSDRSYVSRFGRYEPFDDGRFRRAEHVFRGVYRGRPLTVFDFSAVVDRGENRTERRHHQVVAVGLPSPQPSLAVGPRGFIGGLAQRIGLSFNETGDEKFDSRYAVTTRDKAFAARFLNDDVRRFLLARSSEAVFRIIDDELVVWRRGPLYIDDLEPYADFVNNLLDRVGELRNA